MCSLNAIPVAEVYPLSILQPQPDTVCVFEIMTLKGYVLVSRPFVLKATFFENNKCQLDCRNQS